MNPSTHLNSGIAYEGLVACLKCRSLCLVWLFDRKDIAPCSHFSHLSPFTTHLSSFPWVYFTLSDFPVLRYSLTPNWLLQLFSVSLWTSPCTHGIPQLVVLMTLGTVTKEVSTEVIIPFHFPNHCSVRFVNGLSIAEFPADSLDGIISPWSISVMGPLGAVLVMRV